MYIVVISISFDVYNVMHLCVCGYCSQNRKVLIIKMNAQSICYGMDSHQGRDKVW